MSKILITGAAGFIGFHLTGLLLKETNYEVWALDSLTQVAAKLVEIPVE